jgi:DNA-binding response OmpR family regulator
MRNKILLIDDDEEMCEEIVEALESEGYEVCVSNDGLEGYRLIRENKYDLVLLDVRLPGMSGLDILKRVRETGIETHIIVITGMPMTGAILAEQNGTLIARNELLKLADDVLNKPFNLTTMLAKVRSAMERP